ncbi:MAG: hypothetical protein K6E10_10900 [Eubacterium sp.]|nr:hypothetical protein [Eubacterium sp.]
MRKGFLRTIITTAVASMIFLGAGIDAQAGGAIGHDSSGYDAKYDMYYTSYWNKEKEDSEHTDWQWDYDYVEVDGEGKSVKLLKNEKTGQILKNGWYIVNEEETYFDENGYAYTGFINGRESGDAGWGLDYQTLYKEKNDFKDWHEKYKAEKVRYDWIKDDKGFRYGASGYDYNGEYVTCYLKGDVDWYEDNKTWMTAMIDGKTYRFEADGYLSAEGWFDGGYKDSEGWNSCWKYVTSDGSLARGWTEIDGSYYYFDYYYNMVTDSVVDGYYLDENGNFMSEGWFNNWFWTDKEKGEWEDEWLYINSDGSVATGWNKIGENWYYFDEVDGSMYTNRVADGYYLTEDGTLATGGWYKDWNWIDTETGEWDYQWVYTDSNGYCYNGWNQIDGSWYYFETGQDSYTIEGVTYYYWYSYLCEDQYVDGYYVGSDGVMDTSATADWYQDDKGWYFMDSNGWYPSDTSYVIDGEWYSFDANGYLSEADPEE